MVDRITSSVESVISSATARTHLVTISLTWWPGIVCIWLTVSWKSGRSRFAKSIWSEWSIRSTASRCSIASVFACDR